MVLDSPTQSPTRRQRESFLGDSSKYARSRSWKAAVIAGATTIIAVVVLVPVLVTQLTVHRPDATGQPLNVDYCDQLPERPKELCLNFFASQGEAKFIAATEWRHGHQATYDCAGIEAMCLNTDLTSRSAATSCRPLANGASCGNNQICSAGSCGGPHAASSLEPTASEAEAIAAADGINIDAPAAATPKVVTPAPAFKEAVTSQPKEGDDADEITAAEEFEAHREHTVTVAPNASWPTAVAAIWPSNAGVRIPDTFLSTSHEWRRIKDYGGENMAAWVEIFKMLGPSPVLRIGGASQDSMLEVPGDDVWAALKRFQKASNCRFVIGLPLWQKNALQMSQQIMKAAQENLGDSVLGFELGNEPEFWPTGMGGYDTKGKWVSGFEAYSAYFNRVASALNPCKAGNKPLLSGPGWGNVNTQDPSWFAKMLGQGKCYLWESSVHYYPYINNETVTAPELLSQWLQDFALDKFKAYVGLAKKAGLPVRISETNSLYGGGRAGLSDTMTSAFWVADALFAFSNAGAKAFHLHWGRGGDIDGNNPPSVGVQTNFDLQVDPPLAYPSVHAPWYGYLFWTIATAGGYGKPTDSSFGVANIERWDACTANIKVYSLKATNGDVRVALLNKDLEKSCNIDIRMEPKFCSNKATLTRMIPGPHRMLSKYGITWQGQHYNNAGTTGKIQGPLEIGAVRPVMFKDGKPCSYKISLPATTAALMIVKPDVADDHTT